MRQPTPRRWQAWRVTLNPRPTAPAAPDAVTRRSALIPADLYAETPGPDGIRHGLVSRVRQLIAAGEYDTPERWAAAEERLFDRALAGR
jgi:hypothetical protein